MCELTEPLPVVILLFKTFVKPLLPPDPTVQVTILRARLFTTDDTFGQPLGADGC